MNIFNINPNDFLSNGFILMAGGFLMSKLNEIGQNTVSFIKRFGVYSFQIDNDTPEYEWIASWISSLDYSKNAKAVVLQNNKILRNLPNSEDKKPSLSVLPDYGVHLVKYKDTWMLIDITREKKSISSLNAKSYSERISCYYWTPKGREFLEEIVEAGKVLTENKEEGVVSVYVSNVYEWRNAGMRKFRSVDSIILPPTDKDTIVQDLNDFLQAEDKYFKLGIPWKRGYLFYGVLGTGKSSFIQALAANFKKNIYILTLSNNEMGDMELYNRLSEIKQNSFLLIEDIDCLTDVSRERNKDSMGGSGVSLSGLLNALDGIPAQNGQIVFMTTNCIEKLDSALIRPGRIDVKLKFDYATEEQIEQACKRFFPDKFETVFEIVNRPEKQTMAEIQEKLITLLS